MMKFIGGPHDGEMAPLIVDPEAIVQFTCSCCHAEYRTLIGEEGLWFVEPQHPVTDEDVLAAHRFFLDHPWATVNG